LHHAYAGVVLFSVRRRFLGVVVDELAAEEVCGTLRARDEDCVFDVLTTTGDL
jgi:hypothetical protein